MLGYLLVLCISSHLKYVLIRVTPEVSYILLREQAYHRAKLPSPRLRESYLPDYLGVVKSKAEIFNT